MSAVPLSHPIPDSRDEPILFDTSFGAKTVGFVMTGGVAPPETPPEIRLFTQYTTTSGSMFFADAAQEPSRFLTTTPVLRENLTRSYLSWHNALGNRPDLTSPIFGTYLFHSVDRKMHERVIELYSKIGATTTYSLGTKFGRPSEEGEVHLRLFESPDFFPRSFPLVIPARHVKVHSGKGLLDWLTQSAERLITRSITPGSENVAALDLLDSWLEQDEVEQKESLNYLKEALDMDRPSDRKLFS